MRLFTNSIILCSVLFVISCNPASKKEAEAVKLNLKDGKIYRQDFGRCDTVTNSGASARVELWQPADSGSAAEQIRQFLDEKIIERINSHADSASVASEPGAQRSAKVAFDVFETNYKDFKKDFPDAPGCWVVEFKGDTVMVSPKIVSYQFDHYSFTGGAHPNSFRTFYVFDTQTGSEKEIKSFVSDSVALLRKVETEFRKLEKIGENVNLEDAGYFLSDHKFFLPANYIFTKEGVYFYYNPYEIAAYARGPIEFTIPYADLGTLVKKELIF